MDTERLDGPTEAEEALRRSIQTLQNLQSILDDIRDQHRAAEAAAKRRADHLLADATERIDGMRSDLGESARQRVEEEVKRFGGLVQTSIDDMIEVERQSLAARRQAILAESTAAGREAAEELQRQQDVRIEQIERQISELEHIAATAKRNARIAISLFVLTLVVAIGIAVSTRSPASESTRAPAESTRSADTVEEPAVLSSASSREPATTVPTTASSERSATTERTQSSPVSSSTSQLAPDASVEPGSQLAVSITIEPSVVRQGFLFTESPLLSWSATGPDAAFVNVTCDDCGEAFYQTSRSDQGYVLCPGVILDDQGGCAASRGTYHYRITVKNRGGEVVHTQIATLEIV